MKFDIILPLQEGWSSDKETFVEDGEEITHLQAYLPDNATQSDKALVDIYVGPMPEGSDAESEALGSYAEVVGYDDDEEEEEDPLTAWPFQGGKAFGYEALCEDDSPMRLMTIEIIPEVLATVMVACRDDSLLVSTVEYVEKKLTIKPLD